MNMIIKVAERESRGTKAICPEICLLSNLSFIDYMTVTT